MNKHVNIYFTKGSKFKNNIRKYDFGIAYLYKKDLEQKKSMMKFIKIAK